MSEGEPKTSERTRDAAERLASAVESLKELFTIVMAIALTNMLYHFFVPEGNIRFLKDFTLFESLVFVLLIAMTIRFYHGNVRHLDEVFVHPLCNGEKSKSTKGHARFEMLGVDFVAVFIESLIFGAMSFYTRTFNYLFGMLTVLLMVDVVWFMLVFIKRVRSFKKSHLFPELDHQTLWLVINGGFLVVILIFYALTAHFQIDANAQYWILLILFFGNAAGDIALNWRFYIPSLSKDALGGTPSEPSSQEPSSK